MLQFYKYSLNDLSPNSTWLVTSRLETPRHDTFDVSIPCILAVSSLSNRLSTRSSRRARLVERVVSCWDVTRPRQVEFGH